MPINRIIRSKKKKKRKKFITILRKWFQNNPLICSLYKFCHLADMLWNHVLIPKMIWWIGWMCHTHSLSISLYRCSLTDSLCVSYVCNFAHSNFNVFFLLLFHPLNKKENQFKFYKSHISFHLIINSEILFGVNVFSLFRLKFIELSLLQIVLSRYNGIEIELLHIFLRFFHNFSHIICALDASRCALVWLDLTRISQLKFYSSCF